jgi:hypothetical protein
MIARGSAEKLPVLGSQPAHLADSRRIVTYDLPSQLGRERFVKQ